jgi:hypothetical protein
MLQSILGTIFGCSHQRVSFPQTRRGGGSTATYIACLECGKEFAYDWKNMRVGQEVKSRNIADQMQPSLPLSAVSVSPITPLRGRV